MRWLKKFFREEWIEVKIPGFMTKKEEPIINAYEKDSFKDEMRKEEE